MPWITSFVKSQWKIQFVFLSRSLFSSCWLHARSEFFLIGKKVPFGFSVDKRMFCIVVAKRRTIWTANVSILCVGDNYQHDWTLNRIICKFSGFLESCCTVLFIWRTCFFYINSYLTVVKWTGFESNWISSIDELS